MKFPHNTDAFAFHLACLSTCADQRDVLHADKLDRASVSESPLITKGDDGRHYA